MHRTKQDRRRVALAQRIKDRGAWANAMHDASRAQSEAEGTAREKTTAVKYMAAQHGYTRNEGEIAILTTRLTGHTP